MRMSRVEFVGIPALQGRKGRLARREFSGDGVECVVIVPFATRSDPDPDPMLVTFEQFRAVHWTGARE